MANEKGWGALALAGTLALGTAHARADLIAQESFSYATGTVNGQSGGTGWSGAWITGQTAAFSAGPAISGGPPLGATGGAMQVTGSGRVFRVIDTGPGSAAAIAGLVQSHASAFYGTRSGLGAPGTTVWVGVLVSGGTGNPGDETQYHLYDGAGTDATHLALGDNNKDGEVVALLRGGNEQHWGFERTCSHSGCSGGGGYFATAPSVAFGGTHWSVTRFVFSATTTEITMWRDPTPGSTAPSDASALTLTPFGGGTAAQRIVVPAMFFDTIAPNASGNFGFVVDEIRIGTTFADLGGGAPPTDAGVPPVDGGTPVDAATPGDAGTIVDAGTPSDSGTPSDASMRDAGGLADASPSGVDASTAPTTPASCGCAAPGTSAPAPLAGTFAAAVALLALRRRRARLGRS